MVTYCNKCGNPHIHTLEDCSRYINYKCRICGNTFKLNHTIDSSLLL